MVKSFFSTIFFLSLYTIANGQNIGLHTLTPQAPIHLANSGQVNTPGGFVVIGNTDEAHMELDFNIIQSNYNATPLDLLLQPDGGQIGINTSNPDAQLHIASSGSVNTPGGLVLLGSREEGHLELDFNIIQSRYGASNFLDLALQPAGGKVGVGTSSADALFHVASSGNVNTPGGLMVLGEGSTGHMELDFDLIQARVNQLAAVLRLNPNGGHVGIHTSNPVSPLHIFSDGIPVTEGLLTLGHAGGLHLEMDSDRLQAKSNTAANTLMIQPSGGNTNICNGDLFIDNVNNRVGINDASPSYGLEVNGSIGVTQFLIRRGDDDTYLNMLNNRQQVFAGGQKMLDLSNGALDSIVIGDGGQVDIDINDGIYVDGLDKQVGIGNDFTTPAASLHVKASSNTPALTVEVGTTPALRVNATNQTVLGSLVHIASGGSFPLDTVGGGMLRVGAFNSYAVLIDNDAIQAVNNSKKESTLYLNPTGGDIAIGFGGTSLGFNTDEPASDFHILHFDPNSSGSGIRMEAANADDYWRMAATDGNGFRFYHNGSHVASIQTDGDWSAVSDGRYKKDITYLTNVLDKVITLKPATYHFIDHDANDPLKYGFIAQDVQAVFPEIVDNNDGKLSLKYDMFGVLAIQSIKELKAENDQLRSTVDDLEARLARLEQLVASR